jgi:hypothetical protein
MVTGYTTWGGTSGSDAPTGTGRMTTDRLQAVPRAIPEDRISVDPEEPGAAKRVTRGGSFLCSGDYCSRYLVGSRGKSEVSTGSSNTWVSGWAPMRSDSPQPAPTAHLRAGARVSERRFAAKMSGSLQSPS